MCSGFGSSVLGEFFCSCLSEEAALASVSASGLDATPVLLLLLIFSVSGRAGFTLAVGSVGFDFGFGFASARFFDSDFDDFWSVEVGLACLCCAVEEGGRRLPDEPEAVASSFFFGGDFSVFCFLPAAGLAAAKGITTLISDTVALDSDEVFCSAGT